MSFPWMLVRGASSNPSSLKYQALMNKQSIAENELFKPERQQPSIISAHTEDLILLQDPFTFRKLKTKTSRYRAPWEPDGVLLKYWCRFNHIARKMKDESFSGNYTYPHGSPKLCEGPDDGVKGGTIVSKINYKEDSVDYFTTPDAPGIRVTEATNGFSIYLEFIVESLDSFDGALDATIQYKRDDANNARMVRLSPTDGRLDFIVLKSGVQKIFESPDNAITTNQLYKVFLTYHPTGDVQTMTINGIPQTDSGNGSGTMVSEGFDLIHGLRSTDNLTGRFTGRIKDSRWYNFVVNDDHNKNIWNNGRSICAAPAIQLDGTNDFIDLGNEATLWSQSLTKFSWSMWIYPTLLASGGVNRDILRHGNSGAARFRCDLDGTTSGDAKFYIRNNADSADSTARVAGIVTNKWQQLIGSYDNTLGVDNVRLYLNGVLGYQTANHTEAKNLSVTMTISEANNDFQGYIRDFKWWTTGAVSTGNAALIYQDKYSVLPNYWLKMVEGIGNPVDRIGRTKVGTLTNGALWALHSSSYPIEYGSLAVAGYSHFNDTIDAGGYDSTGYDTTGYDTT